MGPLSEFSIPYKGLKTGIHLFRFQIEDEFFTHFAGSRIERGNFNVSVELDKRDDMLIFDFQIDGDLCDECDRCLQEIDIPVESEFRLVFKFYRDQADDGEVLYLSKSDHQINLSSYIYEFIHLSLPLKKVRDCEKEGFIHCDRKILEAYNARKMKEQEDSVWRELKNLKL